MYESHYNLVCRPFHNTPDPRFFFESDQHREALARLEFAVTHRHGFALITGEIGAGKTTLIHTLLNRLGDQVRAAVINNTRVKRLQLLRMICNSFGLELPADADKSQMLAAIQRFALKQQRVGRTVALLVDESQYLSLSAFEEIRLLTNMESDTDKLIQLLMFGQPELRDMLRHPRMKPLVQRVVVYMHLKPMDCEQMMRYIAFRLVRASVQRPTITFTRRALDLIHQRTKGIPRLVNSMCDSALLIGYAQQTQLIDSAIVRQATEHMLPADLLGDLQADEPPPTASADDIETQAIADSASPDLPQQENDDGRRV